MKNSFKMTDLDYWLMEQEEPGNWLYWLFAAEQSTCDHTYTDIGSFANGESAIDYFQCTKCGYEFSHIYY